MGFDQIIALDLGKFKSVVCLMDARTRKHRFATVDTTPAALHELLVVVPAANAGREPSRTVVVLETCDASGWVHDLAAALGFSVRVADTCHESWKWRRVKRKTDRDDALKLAKMVLLDQLPTVHMPPPDQRQRRRLIQHRRSVVQRRTACKNAIRSIFSQQGLTELLPRGGKAWTAPGIAQFRRHARPMDQCPDLQDLWRARLHVELELLAAVDAQLRVLEHKLDELARGDERVGLLQTVRGIGPRLAEAVVCTLDDVSRFRDGSKVSSYVGLVPKLIESGERSRVGRITRKGPSLLRGLLIEVAWVVWRHNEWAREFVRKVSRGMRQRKKIAIVALARRLLVKLWAMLRTNTPWREPGLAAAAAAAVT